MKEGGRASARVSGKGPFLVRRPVRHRMGHKGCTRTSLPQGRRAAPCRTVGFPGKHLGGDTTWCRPRSPRPPSGLGAAAVVRAVLAAGLLLATSLRGHGYLRGSCGASRVRAQAIMSRLPRVMPGNGVAYVTDHLGALRPYGRDARRPHAGGADQPQVDRTGRRTGDDPGPPRTSTTGRRPGRGGRRLRRGGG